MSVMDLSSVIDSFITGTYVVTRASGASSYVDGRLVAAGTSTLNVDAMVHPAPARELQKLSEGERRRDAKTVYATAQLKTRETGAADLISIDGDSYEIVKVERWAELGAYWKCLALKLGD
jgi:hypothetical protein